MAAHPPTRVAIITVSYGSADVLGSLLESVKAASTADPSVTIADNRAVDEAVRDLASARGATYLPMEGNLGYGGAVNVAAQFLPAEIDWILVVNPDVVMRPGSLDALVAAGDEDDDIGSVGPLTLGSEGEVYPSARAVPSLRTGVGHALFANLWLDNPWSRAYRHDTQTSPIRRDAGWISGSCVLIRRKAFDAIDGFDSGYFMYFEDVDLGYRLGKSGYRNVYEPTAVVVHSGAHSTTADSARMITAHHDSARRFLNRKYSRRILLPIRIGLTIGLQLRSALMRRRLSRR
jgi:N-acetylglucosaminyl-diphospho-decaprenol L-rhamnosyltransferase